MVVFFFFFKEKHNSQKSSKAGLGPLGKSLDLPNTGFSSVIWELFLASGLWEEFSELFEIAIQR